MKGKRNPCQELDASKQSKPHQQRLTIGCFSTDIRRDFALWPWLGVVDVAHQRNASAVTFPLKTLRFPNGFETRAHLIGQLVEASRSWTLRDPMASGIRH